jgi:hypothetical protein
MRRVLLLAGLALAALASAARAADKGTKVSLDGLSSTTPAGWVEVKLPARSMRFAQFRVPAAKGDKDDAELIVFKLGGSAKDNVNRWKMQFQPPAGKTRDEVSKVTEFKVAGYPATMLQTSGTYKAPPFDPTWKGKTKENFRLVGVQIDGDNTYQIKLLGPAKTVEAAQKSFEAWVKGFKK